MNVESRPGDGKTVIVDPATLTLFAFDLLAAVGVPADDAKIVAAHLVQANLCGVDTHGIGRLPGYIRRFKAGGTNTHTRLEVVSDLPAMVLLDANNGIGQVASYHAMKMAIQRAETTGVTVVGVKNSNHFGRAGYYALMAVERDMIGIAMSTTNRVVSTGNTAKAAVGNNPWSIAVPTLTGPPVVIDMACSVVSAGRIMAAAADGDKVPRGWGLDQHGRPTDNPSLILKGGCLLPFGGYKGFGLALAVGIMAGMLTGSGLGRSISIGDDDPSQPTGSGHLFAAVKVGAFTDTAVFKKEMIAYIREIKALPACEDGVEPRLPGERLFQTEHLRRVQGIPIPAFLLNQLREIAQEVGVGFAI